ncbi:MAG: hypothetical protein NT172_03250 [Planctomycetota bacterium]|nr:hypothetical protein [Planctomycetota bacterium]RLT12884.1 MAG: hypothetical protein DWI24_05350 [Planctomycetota bacterium]
MMIKRFTGLQKNRPMMIAICAGMTLQLINQELANADSPSPVLSTHQNLRLNWVDSLKITAQGGRPTLILITSGTLPYSSGWAESIHKLIETQSIAKVACAEILAESEPAQSKALRIRTLPTALLYQSDGKNGLQLAGFIEGSASHAQILKLIAPDKFDPATLVADYANLPTPRRVVKIQRASASSLVEAESPAKPASGSVDEQVSATTHQNYAQASAQGSPQSFNPEPPNKQLPPAPFKTPLPQQSPPLQAPPQQQQPPAYGTPGPQPQPVYAYVPQQPVYSAPPSGPPLTVQPPAGQVVVQPAPLNVILAPAPPPQVTYLSPAMGAPQPQPVYSAAPPANAFTAAPPVYSQPAYAAPQPNYAPQQAAMGAAQPTSGGSSSMLMTVAPNLLDRFLGGLGRVLAERGNPRLRMSMESPAYFAAPMGVSQPPGAPLQAYMAVPNAKGGDATEDYVKAYIALCKEKGITPTLPGMDPPPAPPSTGPTPSPQGLPAKKKGLFH